MAQENFDKDNVSTSKFYMLRCLIAIAHQDGVVCDEERAYIHALMNRLPLTSEQEKTLTNDLETPQDIGQLFSYINDPRYRGQVLYFVRIIAYKDGTLSPSEQEILDRLHAMATDGIDIETIRGDAQKAAAIEIGQHEINIDQYRPEGGLFGLFDRIMLHYGIDLLKE